jgi:hypothetical protein
VRSPVIAVEVSLATWEPSDTIGNFWVPMCKPPTTEHIGFSHVAPGIQDTHQLYVGILTECAIDFFGEGPSTEIGGALLFYTEFVVLEPGWQRFGVPGDRDSVWIEPELVDIESDMWGQIKALYREER